MECFFLYQEQQRRQVYRAILFKNVYSSLDKSVIVEKEGAAWYWCIYLTFMAGKLPEKFGCIIDQTGLIDLSSIQNTENLFNILNCLSFYYFLLHYFFKTFQKYFSLSFCVICWKVIRSLSIKIWSDRTSNCSVEEKYEQ